MLGLLFVGILVFINFIMAYSVGLAGKPHKSIVLENTLPQSQLKHPDVVALGKEYRQRLLWAAGLFSLLSCSLFLIHYEAIFMTLFWLFLLLPMVSMWGIEVHYIRKMGALKAAKGWQLPVTPVQIDTKLLVTKNQKILGFGWLLPPLVLTIGLCIFAWFSNIDGKLIYILTAIFLWIVAWVCWYVVGRLPVAAPSEDPQINRQYNDLTKHDWSVVAVGVAYGMLVVFALPVLSMSLPASFSKLLAALFILLTFGSIFLCIWYLLHLRKKQDQLLATTARFRYADKDQYWRYGVYINPDDKTLMVSDRIGLNIGVNFGRPAGKVLGVLTLLLVLGLMVFTLYPTYLWDFGKDSFTANLQQERLELAAPFVKPSEIELADIESAKLVTALPAPTTRTNGYGGRYYQMGKFEVAGKNATLYLDTRSKPYLQIVTAERDYYFTFKQASETKAFYHHLTKALPAHD